MAAQVDGHQLDAGRRQPRGQRGVAARVLGQAVEQGDGGARRLAAAIGRGPALPAKGHQPEAVGAAHLGARRAAGPGLGPG